METAARKTVSIVVPCYNEAEVLPLFLAAIVPLADGLPQYDWEFLFVNDGSQDLTEAILVSACSGDSRIKYISLSRNFGHQRAITAGLDWCEGHYVIIIDADLQDPPALIPDMIARLEEGFDVVHAVRADRTADSFAKRNSARLFYAFMRRFVLPDLPENSGDFKAFNRRVLHAVLRYPERVRFLRGALATVGFNQTTLPFTRASRAGGKSKYSWWRMLHLSRDAIFSNSIWPLRLALPAGLLVEAILACLLVSAVANSVVHGAPAPTLTESLLFLTAAASGALLIFLGVLGEYIKILLFEVKHRPVYLVQRTENLDSRSRATHQDHNSIPY